MQSVDAGTAILRLPAALRATVARFELQWALRAAPGKELGRQVQALAQLRGHIDVDRRKPFRMNHLAVKPD